MWHKNVALILELMFRQHMHQCSTINYFIFLKHMCVYKFFVLVSLVLHSSEHCCISNSQILLFYKGKLSRQQKPILPCGNDMEAKHLNQHFRLLTTKFDSGNASVNVYWLAQTIRDELLNCMQNLEIKIDISIPSTPFEPQLNTCQ